MSRNTKTITITRGRDKDKEFLITEKSAYESIMWATRAVLVLAKSGAELPDYATGQGLAGIGLLLSHDAKAFLALLAGVEFEKAKPLMDDLLSCVQLVTKAAMYPIDPEIHIEDISTITTLYSEVFKLHANFTQGENG